LKDLPVVTLEVSSGNVGTVLMMHYYILLMILKTSIIIPSRSSIL